VANLVTTATIRANDQLTAGLGAIVGKVSAANRKLAESGKATFVNAGRASAGIAASAFGLSGLLDKAEAFNRHIFGIGAAGLVDTMKSAQAIKKGLAVDETDALKDKIDVGQSIKEMEHMTELSLKMGRAMGFSSSKVAEIGETFAKAGLKEGLEDITKATVTLSKADTETPAKAIADYMHTLTVLQKPRDGESFGDFVRREADMVMTAADQTKLSVGSIMEGMRQFQTVGAGLGMKSEDMLAMMMVGAQVGFGASEFGTAMKSDMTRLLKRTAEGQQVLSRLGININDAEFTKGTSGLVSDSRAVASLNAALSIYGGVKGNEAAAIKKLIAAGSQSGANPDQIVDQVTAQLARSKGVVTGKDRAALRQSVESSIVTKTGDLNPIAVWRKMIAAGATDADIAGVFEGRHLARNKALQKAIADGTYDQYVQLLKRMKGQGLDAMETLWSKSPYGNVQAMKAAIERLWIVLANTEGVQRFVNSVERLMDGLGQIDPRVLDMGLKVMALGAALGIAGPALSAMSSPLGIVAAAAGVVAYNLQDAGDIMTGFSSGMKTSIAEFAGSAAWAEFRQSLNGVSEAMLNIFGIKTMDPLRASMQLGMEAANGLVAALTNVADGFSLLYDMLAALGLVKERMKKAPGTSADGVPDYMRWNDETMAYEDQRSFVARQGDTAKAWWSSFEAGWNRLLDVVHGENRQGGEAQKRSAEQLSEAATALKSAAGALGDLRSQGGSRAQAAPPVVANGGQYGGQ
jgi:TP901 family phage tail tape measure protein